ncbi:OsmC family protein [Corynebacterium lizhenjunii]|uniref:OsmC family protein n=1 Tax=Corynebacterium lizhenjunii TaxID=2709394 RepID=A0A7T0KF97_9CORY|nr:OsmC family protein [Corynebacterium lizhenjunii]QPK79454.1 OsmC family protein [Corynebacterium lizhenjunii]
MDSAQIVKQYAVDVERVGLKHYRATSPSGAQVDYGQGEGLLTPVELLLAGVAGCAAVDVDVVTARRSEPERFNVHVEGDRVNEDGASRLSAVRVSFDVQFPDTPEGRQAQSMLGRLIEVSHDKDCTASRTVEHPTEVTFDHK